MKRLMFLVAAVALASAPAFAADKKIERLWKSKCASCHGPDGKGETEKGKKMKVADMTSADWQKKSDDDLKKAIADGIKTEKDGVKKEMDSYKDDVKGEQLDGMIKLMREFKK